MSGLGGGGAAGGGGSAGAEGAGTAGAGGARTPAATAIGAGRPVRRLRVLRASAGQAARAQLAFRASTWAAIIGIALQTLLVVLVWRAVYGDRTEVADVDNSQAVAYAVLAGLLSAVLQPFMFDSLYRRLRTGAIVFDVTRPLSAPPLALAQQVGASAAQLPAAAAGFAVGLAMGALALPARPAVAAVFVVSLLLGYAISLLTNFVVGLVGFWTTEVGGAFLIYAMLARFSSGALIPLWFMPEWLQTALSLLPFSSQVFVPLSIYLDDDHGAHTLRALGVQAVWIVLLSAVAVLVWRRAIRRLVVVGG